MKISKFGDVREKAIYVMTRQNRQKIQKLMYFCSSSICGDHRLILQTTVPKKRLWRIFCWCQIPKILPVLHKNKKTVLALPVVILDTLFVIPSQHIYSRRYIFAVENKLKIIFVCAHTHLESSFGHFLHFTKFLILLI